MDKLRIGYCLTGSYCTFEKSIRVIEILCARGHDVFPIMSEHAYMTDTRFGKAEEHIAKIELLCGNKVLHTIAEAEPIGPKKYIDVLVISPCTGNTLSKLANGITDTSVTMAAKASLRNSIPVVIALATNDGLSQSAKSLGTVLALKNVYFVPLGQDDCVKKPTSLVCDFDKVEEAIENAVAKKQLQPILI